MAGRRLWHGLVEDRVFLHPASYNAAVGEFRCPWLVFHEKAQAAGGSAGPRPSGEGSGGSLPPRTLIRDSSATAPYALLLFGGPIAVRHEDTLVTVGTHGWIRFQ